MLNWREICKQISLDLNLKCNKSYILYTNTTNNKSFAIEGELSRFLASARTLCKTAVFPDKIVTDFSSALVDACILSFNKMALSRYLEIVYKMMINRAERLE